AVASGPLHARPRQRRDRPARVDSAHAPAILLGDIDGPVAIDGDIHRAGQERVARRTIVALALGLLRTARDDPNDAVDSDAPHAAARVIISRRGRFRED